MPWQPLEMISSASASSAPMLTTSIASASCSMPRRGSGCDSSRVPAAAARNRARASAYVWAKGSGWVMVLSFDQGPASRTGSGPLLEPLVDETDPQRAAERDQVVVEVVVRVVQGARAQVVRLGRVVAAAVAVGQPVPAVAVADDEIRAGLLEQEVAEVLGRHRRLECQRVLGADRVAHDAGDELGLGL